MAKFMFVYRDSGKDDTQPSPEQMQQALQVWMDWIAKGTEAGWLVDGGDALHGDGRLVAPDASVTDGPFAESKELVSGYSIVDAEGYDAAAELAKTCPMVTIHQGFVEVRQLREIAEES